MGIQVFSGDFGEKDHPIADPLKMLSRYLANYLCEEVTSVLPSSIVSPPILLKQMLLLDEVDHIIDY